MSLRDQQKLSIVSYAVNGSGLGHLVRMVALNRWMRRYAAACGRRTQHWFLTTSEADTLLFHEGFAGFKLPSKSVVEESGIPKAAYLALAKQWVWHSLALVRPDLLVVDTFPNGSFGELLGALDLVEKKALVLRPVKDDFARRGSFQAMAALYDKIIVPEHDDEDGFAAKLGVDQDRVTCTGPVMRHEAFERLPRDVARARLGVPDGARCLLVTGGGGGDATVERLFEVFVRLADERAGVHLVLAAGPLYRGRPWRSSTTTFLTGDDLALHLDGVDAAVCAAGFNVVHELLFAGVPTCLLPVEKIADDQGRRAAALTALGAALSASLDDEGSLRRALDALLDDQRAAALRAGARQAVPRNHARDAAREALSLVLPEDALRRAVETIDDALLAEAGALGVKLEDLVDLAAALSSTSTLQRGLDLRVAQEVARAAASVGAPLQSAARVAALLAKKLRGRRPPTAAQVAKATIALVAHPTAAGQWPALPVLLQSLVVEKDCGPDELVVLVCGLLDRFRAHGKDVFSAARFVVLAHAELGDELSSNRPILLRAAGLGGLS